MLTETCLAANQSQWTAVLSRQKHQLRTLRKGRNTPFGDFDTQTVLPSDPDALKSLVLRKVRNEQNDEVVWKVHLTPHIASLRPSFKRQFPFCGSLLYLSTKQF